MGELRVITGSHMACRRSQNENSDVTEKNRADNAMLLALKMEDGTTARGCRQSPEARKVKDRFSPHYINSQLFPPRTQSA